jgi:hypothetical protein
MGPRYSLLCLDEPLTGHCPEINPLSILLLLRSSLILFSHLCLGLPSCHFRFAYRNFVWILLITCAIQKVVGSLPKEVFGCFNWPNPSSCIMALGYTQPLTEMSTRNFLEVKDSQLAHKADSLTANCPKDVGALTSHNPRGLHDVLEG